MLGLCLTRKASTSSAFSEILTPPGIWSSPVTVPSGLTATKKEGSLRPSPTQTPMVVEVAELGSTYASMGLVSFFQLGWMGPIMASPLRLSPASSMPASAATLAILRLTSSSNLGRRKLSTAATITLWRCSFQPCEVVSFASRSFAPMLRRDTNSPMAGFWTTASPPMTPLEPRPAAASAEISNGTPTWTLSRPCASPWRILSHWQRSDIVRLYWSR
mmetsp:Transcript_6033/g.10985  ORF Transcript_6033/g.10985 Transcript_6033/m.10985 type:complete len:217 (+) Transcript_6033:2537-3187(+)